MPISSFSNNSVRSLVLFEPYIGPYQVLPLRVTVDLGRMTIKEYSAFPKYLINLSSHGTLHVFPLVIRYMSCKCLLKSIQLVSDTYCIMISALARQLVEEKENSEFKSIKLHFEN